MRRTKRQYVIACNVRKIIADNPSKSRSELELWILTGGRSSLSMHIAATENVSPFAPILREERFRNEL